MFRNKKVLITGCYGFVAQHLIIKLLRNNNIVTGIYNKKYQVEIYDNSKFIKQKKFTIIKGDITNEKFLKNLFYEKFDLCIHLAAVSQVLLSNKSPLDTLKTNIFGTINLLENVRKFQPKIKFIFSSTDKVYGESNKLPYLENFPLNALNPYDASKASADIICRTYAKSFNLDICVTRFVNIYGPGDLNWNRLIPGIIKSLIDNQKPILRSNGKFLRDYIYIDDLLKAYDKIFYYMNKNERKKHNVFNFSNNNPIEVIKVVKIILRNFKKNENYFIIKNQVKNEIENQYSDSNLAKKILNWKPNVKLSKGIKKTIFWYKKYI